MFYFKIILKCFANWRKKITKIYLQNLSVKIAQFRFNNIKKILQQFSQYKYFLLRIFIFILLYYCKCLSYKRNNCFNNNIIQKMVTWLQWHLSIFYSINNFYQIFIISIITNNFHQSIEYLILSLKNKPHITNITFYKELH